MQIIFSILTVEPWEMLYNIPNLFSFVLVMGCRTACFSLTLFKFYLLLFSLQKYGYELPDINVSQHKDMLLERKDPRQIFYGLQPGWVINLEDKTILKPTDPELKEHYAS